MARPLRIDIPGGWYHVVNRGAEKRTIFPNAEANEHFLELLSKLPDRFAVKIHGYVLMATHYHLQIETQNANLSQAMQWLNVSYRSWYNRLHERRGHLFGGRWKSILHDPKTTALTINRYIHLNPVRAAGLGETERPPISWVAICAAVSQVWKGDWNELSTVRGNGALPAAWYLARHFSAMRLSDLGDADSPAISAALNRFEKRLKIDRELQRKLKATRVLLKI
jgi:putative transposase